MMNDGNTNDAIGSVRFERQCKAITTGNLEPSTSTYGQQSEAIIAAKLKMKPEM